MPHADPEVRRAYYKAWKLKNRERVRDYARAYWHTIDPAKKLGYQARYRAENKFKIALLANKHQARLGRYVACSASIDEIAAAYTGRCHNPACKTGQQHRRLALDHDHLTGKFRGWLCSRCNISIGHANDSVAVLSGLISYLGRRGD